MTEVLTSKQYNHLLQSDRNIEVFTLAKRVLLAKVIDVYDGDTCKVNIYLHGDTLKQFTIRMNGYDCPELRTKNALEKKYAVHSKSILQRLILDKVVKLECLEFDKYGRILGRIYVKNSKGETMDVNQYMLDNHLGYSYSGSTKKSFSELLDSGYYKDNSLLETPETMHYENSTASKWCFCWRK